MLERELLSVAAIELEALLVSVLVTQHICVYDMFMMVYLVAF